VEVGADLLTAKVTATLKPFPLPKAGAPAEYRLEATFDCSKD
jgi:hypothetical protein